MATLGLASGASAAAGPVEPTPRSAYLSPRDANAVLGSWGLGGWRHARSVPAVLRFDRSCSTDPRGGTARVLRERSDASIRSVVARRGTEAGVARTYRALAGRVGGCVSARAASERLVPGRLVRTGAGEARVFGLELGRARSSRTLEYVVVARSEHGVEVATFHAFAQDTLPPRTLRLLTGAVLHRLVSLS